MFGTTFQVVSKTSDIDKPHVHMVEDPNGLFCTLVTPRTGEGELHMVLLLSTPAGGRRKGLV